MPRNRQTLTSAACAIALAASLAPLPAASAAPTTTTPTVAPTVAAEADILDRLKALPGFTAEEVTQNVPEGYRFFRMTVQQPADHDDPSKGTFTQRLTLLHRDVSRPTVFFTSGYHVSQTPGRSEPTRIVDGNQVSMEYRFFAPSRPEKADWRTQLTIEQAADDQHRIYEALRTIYDRKWIATGGSKGGMTATYYRYFHPNDMAGTVPYVAPNDVVNDKDEYNRFLSRVGNPTCRADLVDVQRRALGTDRAWFVGRLEKAAAADKLTFGLVGSVDKALEVGVVDTFFAFWQYQPETACGRVPDAATATREELWNWFAAVAPLTTYSDQELEAYVPYYFQAAAQLGWPQPYEGPLRDLLKYPGADQPVTFLPDELKQVRFDRRAMRDVDRWVRKEANRIMFVDGRLDPWSAEPFRCGNVRRAAERDCLRFVVENGNHGATIQALPEPTRTLARTKIQQWAGLTSGDRAVTNGNRGAGTLRLLDKPMVQNRLHGM